MNVATLLLLASLGGIALGAGIINVLYATTFGTQWQVPPATLSRKTPPTGSVDPQPPLVGRAPSQAPAVGDAFGTADLDTTEECWPPLPTLLPGTVFHGFLVERHLGEGSQGRVYLAARPDGHQVALKGSSDPVAWATEALCLRQLAHPGVPRCLAAFQEDDSFWLALEYIPGTTPAPGLPRGEVLRLGAQVAGILAALHAQGLLHRDVKPENLLVRPGGRAVLLDFGVAHHMRWREKPTFGTPGYTSPEQWRGTACPASDVYALGISLWEVLSGELPDPLSEEEEFPPLPPDSPPGLEPLLRAMLALVPAQRPTAIEVEICLASLLHRPAYKRLFGLLAALMERAARRGRAAALPWRLRTGQRSA